MSMAITVAHGARRGRGGKYHTDQGHAPREATQRANRRAPTTGLIGWVCLAFLIPITGALRTDAVFVYRRCVESSFRLLCCCCCYVVVVDVGIFRR